MTDPVRTITVSIEETEGPVSWSEVLAPPPAPDGPSWSGEWCSIRGPEGVLARYRLRLLPGTEGRAPESGPGPPPVAG
jgi:hypothetical protein